MSLEDRNSLFGTPQSKRQKKFSKQNFVSVYSGYVGRKLYSSDPISTAGSEPIRQPGTPPPPPPVLGAFSNAFSNAFSI